MKKRQANPFFRKSFLSMLFRGPKMLKTWQVGDGREDKLLNTVLATARAGDANDAIRIIDEFAWGESFLMNVGDKKGLILDVALKNAAPHRILELGTYCGYSALRMAVAAPQAHIFSIEFSAANKAIAERILTHAGVGNRVTIIHGTIGDGGKTIAELNNSYGFKKDSLDFVFIDHDKKYYLSDLKLILNEAWLRRGAVVVADNIKFPGAPAYQAYMDAEEGRTWQTQAHETNVEYQSLIKDRVLVSKLI